MKRLGLLVVLLAFLAPYPVSFATEYGDLYHVEWCPCNPDDRYGPDGAEVLGTTVMCPCDSTFDGYKKTLEKDLREVERQTKKAFQTAKSYKYYVGVDYNKSQFKSSGGVTNFDELIFSQVNGLDVPNDLMLDDQDNIGIVLGTRPHKNFGIEAFYNRTYNKNTVTQIDNETIGHIDYHMVNTFVSKYQAYGIDLIGYLPVTDYFDFLAFVGLGKYEFDNKATFEKNYLEGGTGTPAVDTSSFDFSESQWAWRVGGGVQFNIARGVALRSMYRFIKVNGDVVKYLQEFSVGIRFLF